MYDCLHQQQESLKTMRKIDDNIVYLINSTIPTVSFASKDQKIETDRCKDLHQQLNTCHRNRENLIRNCIKHTSDRIRVYTETNGFDDATKDRISKKLRTEQTQLRLLRKELNVEEVIQERSAKILNEKCRPFYRPPAWPMTCIESHP